MNSLNCATLQGTAPFKPMPRLRPDHGRLRSHASALSDARFGKDVEAGTVFCARSIKPLEGSRPWLRRTRALWRLNEGRLRWGACLKLCNRAWQMTAGTGLCERVSRRRRGGSWKKRFALRQGAEKRSTRKRAEDSSSRESFHAAAVTRGGERSWISAAVNLSRTTIGPPHLGQRQRSFE